MSKVIIDAAAYYCMVLFCFVLFCLCIIAGNNRVFVNLNHITAGVIVSDNGLFGLASGPPFINQFQVVHQVLHPYLFILVKAAVNGFNISQGGQYIVSGIIIGAGFC